MASYEGYARLSSPPGRTALKPSSKLPERRTPPPAGLTNSVRIYSGKCGHCQLTVVAGIFHSPISIAIGKSEKTVPTSTPLDLDVTFEAKERQRLELKAGTDVGNTEVSGYANVLYRNVLGGAETLGLNATYGTRTRSVYQGVVETPLFGRPGLRLALGGTASTTQKTWASHEEVVKGGFAKLRWLTPAGHQHEIAYNSAWRQVTGLASNASPTVRGDAGNSVKSSVSYAWESDRRDHPLLPSRGYLLRTVSELADRFTGAGPLASDVSFVKSELDAQGALPVPLPGVKHSGISLTAGVRAGLLYPLGQGADGRPAASRINDRFQLGGPTDVRGFRTGGLGPRDGPDAVGGDVYVAGSANVLFPVPGVGAERPLRWQLFVNGGRLLGLREGGGGKDKGAGPDILPRSLRSALADLGDGLPSTAAGIGLVYAHSMARFELNFTLPLVQRQGEDARKGLQFGIGLNFL